MRMIFGAIGGMKIGRGNRSTRRKPTPVPLCPPQNPTWQTRSRTLDRSGGKPATNRLSYGAAVFSPISSPLKTHRFTVEVFDPASTRVFLILCSMINLWQFSQYRNYAMGQKTWVWFMIMVEIFILATVSRLALWFYSATYPMGDGAPVFGSGVEVYLKSCI
jgi:hypothetical protein